MKELKELLKRCYCNSGECENCLLDRIDEKFNVDPTFRYCTCTSVLCLICNYYKKLLDQIESGVL